MRFFLRLSACFAALATLLSVVPSTAQAQGASVYVLGLRSIEGDDEFARELSGVIRVAAGRIPGWEVAPDEVTLSQMTMMHACDEPNRACMGAIASELGAVKIIYGTIVRRGDDGYGLTLYLYDHPSTSIEDQLSDTIPRGETGMEVLRPRAQRYTAQLGGQARFGSLRLEVGEPSATVRVDGNAVGVTDAAGTILVEDLTEGDHEVEVDAEGFDALRTTVAIEGDDQTEVRVNLNAPSAGGGANLGWIPGAVVIAGGVVSFAMGIRSGLKVQSWDGEISDVRGANNIDALAECVRSGNANSNLNGGAENIQCDVAEGGQLTRAQALVLSGSGDVCRSGQTGQQDWQSDACSEHNRHTILQYVLYGIGAVGIGVGTFLLLRSLGDDEDDSSVDLSISPWMAGRDGGVDMTLTW
ncbi:MAG: PEGA domain-containing protein [Polyangiales bacterium]